MPSSLDPLRFTLVSMHSNWGGRKTEELKVEDPFCPLCGHMGEEKKCTMGLSGGAAIPGGKGSVAFKLQA